MMSKITQFLMVSFLVAWSNLILAEDEQNKPQQVVQNAIETILTDIDHNRELYQQDNEAFYNYLNQHLNTLVDIEGVTKSIMTVKYIKQATPTQIEVFQDTFKRSLLKFYGDALLSLGKIDVKYLSSKISDKDSNRSSVNTEAKAANNTIYPISYTMVKIEDKWLLRNVIVGGINIGKLFREQFGEQMKKNRNNLDLTIAGWDEVVKAQIDNLDNQSALAQENTPEIE